MAKTFSAWVWLLVAVSMSTGVPVRAEVHAANLFSDHMVVQRGKPVRVWGWADPNETVAVTLGPDYAEVVADSTGMWDATLAPLKAKPGNAALELTLKGNGSAVVIHDVLVGEVWLASGQSNMAFEMAGVLHAKDEIAASNHPDIRMFTVMRGGYSPLLAKDVKGTWVLASPAKTSGFSAVAYYFALKLESTLHVPVGIIHSSVGGTPVRAWTSLRAVESNPDLLQRTTTEVNHAIQHDAEMQAYEQARSAWEAQYGVSDTTVADAKVLAAYSDPGSDTAGWNASDFPLAGKAFQAPATGAVTWFRGTFEVTADVAAQQQRLSLGLIRESCIVWLNGVRVGDAGLKATDRMNGNMVVNFRPGQLHVGKNTLVLRIFSHAGPLTKFGSTPVTLSSGSGDAVTVTPVKATWVRKTEVSFPAVDAAGLAAYPVIPAEVLSTTSTVLYQGMIAPLRDYGISGAIWYQGESNAGQADYGQILAMMIADWRRQWHETFPFYLVQLPNYAQQIDVSTDRSGWAFTRELQQKVTAAVPNTAMAVTIDVGLVRVLHPPDKRPVGERLALLALARVYKQPVEDSGPVYVSAKAEGSAMRITLAHADGLRCSDDVPHEFLIAGPDRKFHPAEAKIDGETLVVSSPDVPKPEAVRYAYVDGPQKADVYNAAGLPLAPFRTDDWVFPIR